MTVTCIDFAISHYAKVINFSWGDPSWNSQALYDAINAAGNAGIIFTAACGNLAANTDYNPYYPASYALGNLISVAATTRKDQLASYSSYGPNTVSLGAPGDTIISCWNSSDSSYQYLSGTSMAAPLVAGMIHPRADRAGLNLPMDWRVLGCHTNGALSRRK